MSLTPMQEIFILLEDEKKVPFYRLQRWGRPARGVLAKLKNMGLAQKINFNNEIYYEITENGEKYADEILSVLKQNNVWDKKWRLIIFDIPESRRSTRDKMRRHLSAMGLGLLQSSVYISFRDIKTEIDTISEKHKVNDKIKYFEVNSNQHLNGQIIEKLWNEDKDTNLLLERFIKDANWAMKGMGKGNGDKFNAKKLVFEYASILKKSPQLPDEFTQMNELRRLALETYKNLRRFIV